MNDLLLPFLGHNFFFEQFFIKADMLIVRDLGRKTHKGLFKTKEVRI
jgi:hypothetical protein